MRLLVNAAQKTMAIGNRVFPCRIGRNGFIDGAHGVEGDEKTPLGKYTLRFGLYRADRLPTPPSPLIFWPLREDDGWCDDKGDLAYNRFVRLPYKASHEKLWREDGAYDIIIVISHNDSPPKPGHGSAVFIHIAQPDDRETLGCIAVTPDIMAKIIGHLQTGMPIKIQA